MPSVRMDLPGESRPARFEPVVWPPQVQPVPAEPAVSPQKPLVAPNVPVKEPA